MLLVFALDALGKAEPLNILYWNGTASLPVGFYAKVPCCEESKPLKRGDLVVYQPSPQTVELGVERGYMKETTLFMKEVGAVAGDRYTVTPDLKFLLNGEYYGVVYTEDNKGRPMPRKIGVMEVPEGYFLPVADAPRSFDGRYTGPEKIESIKAVVRPVLTGIHW